MELPKLPIGAGAELLVDAAETYLGWLFDFITIVIKALVGNFADLLNMMSPLLFIVIVSAIAWRLAGNRVAIGSALGLLLILNMGMWKPAMDTIALVLIATLFALIISIPLGILTARYQMAHRVVMPILDFMQTMPPFVYLVPVVILFAIGEVPGLIATVVFAMPPAIRLTGLGIRQVPEDLIEAAEAFGATESQKLFKVQLPLAMPTIMAGVNQCILLALSMVVIAAMVGVGGLGGMVLRGIQRLDVGLAFEAGLSIVIIAIILDRITQKIGFNNKTNK
ncbi:ABC transporter permease [Desulfofalx alkaliphila]|uniref:ABC transporter permease n=1 Tax=Desulfofalx alkaliphila TaxID=105483 RepID=UPI0004E1BC11|nr:proline/glycine betaine ABC transporter permease [Desulfofalx alkaliphila]